MEQNLYQYPYESELVQKAPGKQSREKAMEEHQLAPSFHQRICHDSNKSQDLQLQVLQWKVHL